MAACIGAVFAKREAPALGLWPTAANWPTGMARPMARFENSDQELPRGNAIPQHQVLSPKDHLLNPSPDNTAICWGQAAHP